MVYTITFNPAIDYVIHTNELQLGKMNRTQAEEIYFGGKGINVSVALRELGIKSVALGFVAGFTGAAIEEGLKEKGIKTDFVHLAGGNSRINIKIKCVQETEINAQGPDVYFGAIKDLLAKFDRIEDGDTIVISGSIPKALPDDIYQQMLGRITGKRIKAVVDATGDLLLETLQYRPFLIKPNREELEELFDVEIKTVDEIKQYAMKLHDMGAQNVIVSMDADGAVLVDADGNIHECAACKGTVKNSVGAGDAMVAGFLAGIEDNDYEYALKLGTAAGGATAFAEGMATKAEIDAMLATL